MNQAADQQTHVVVGVGPVGTALAGELLGLGHRVRTISRSGRRPTDLDQLGEHLSSHPHLEALTLDAAAPPP